MSDWQTAAHDPEDCPACRPTVFDPATRQPVGGKIQAAADRVWRSCLPAERVAWHRVTCLNSRHPTDMALAQEIVGRIATLRPPGGKHGA